MTRYIEKDSTFQIDYVKFVEVVERAKTSDDIQLLSSSMAHFELEQFSVIKDNLSNYLSEKGIQPGRVIRKLYEKKNGDTSGPKLVSVEDFGEFLYGLNKATNQSRNACEKFARKIDINNDGYIDDTDFNTFLNRGGYIQEAEKSATKVAFQTTPTSAELFPKVPLSEERTDVVLRDLRKALENKGVSYYDFVRMLDLNETGFITINDFFAGLDKVIQFSQPTKDGLFAYIDKRRIGMITHDEVLKLLNRSVLDKKEVDYCCY